MVLPDTLAGQSVVSQKSIPCICWIGEGGFQIRFTDPLFGCIGQVHEWDQKTIDMLAPAYGGSNYTHFNFAQITLELIKENDFKINGLSLFYSSSGWVDVVDGGKYAEIIEDEDDW